MEHISSCKVDTIWPPLPKFWCRKRKLGRINSLLRLRAKASGELAHIIRDEAEALVRGKNDE